MKCSMLCRVLGVLLVGFSLAVGGAAQTPGAAEVRPASGKELSRLMSAYEDGLAKEDAVFIAKALDAMGDYNNPELKPVAITSLKYKASKFDKKAAKQEAKDLGLKAKEIKRIQAEREALVQSLGARLLGNYPGKEAETILYKAFKDKKIRKEKPTVTAALIEAMGRIEFRKPEAEIEKEYKAYANREIMRASIRYFGQIKSKSRSVVRTLCGDLDPPEPGNVDDPSNPPSSYWAARWESWAYVSRDVSWALKQITGQDFQPGMGDKQGDSAKALRYVKEHEKELGLK